MTVVVHLTASRFFGGPERQILGLARHLPAEFRTVLASFREGGHCAAFLDEARRQGIESVALQHDTPRLLAAARETEALLQCASADVLCCHGYKANLVGRWAARRAGVPVVAVARGWTSESWKVYLYEMLDRLGLRRMDHVVCVSLGQRHQVIQTGVPGERTSVIRSAIDLSRFARPDPAYRAELHGFFRTRRPWLVGAAGRFSPEKGFPVLISAAAKVVRRHPDVGFVLFGAGPLQAGLARQIAKLGLEEQVVLPGFRADLDRFMPFFDLFVLPSFTEGLPNVVLEAMAASVPVIATAAGGTPELVDDEQTGFLVPAGDFAALARRISELLPDDARRHEMGRRGRRRVAADFGFTSHAEQYREFFHRFLAARAAVPREVGREQKRHCSRSA